MLNTDQDLFQARIPSKPSTSSFLYYQSIHLRYRSHLSNYNFPQHDVGTSHAQHHTTNEFRSIYPSPLMHLSNQDFLHLPVSIIHPYCTFAGSSFRLQVPTIRRPRFPRPLLVDFTNSPRGSHEQQTGDNDSAAPSSISATRT